MASGFNEDNDLFEMLHEDHDRLRDLIARLDGDINGRGGAGDADEREEVVAALHDEFTLHSEPEEEVVYATMAESGTVEELVADAEDEHGNVKDLLGYLATLEADDARFGRAFDELREAVEDHLEKEESEFFAAVREVCDEEELKRLAADYRRSKEKLRSERQRAA